LSTTGCGHASATNGTGVALGGGQILTVAHVVFGSSSVDVTTPQDAKYSGQVIAIDVERDLALIQIVDDELGPVALATAAVGDEAVVETRNASVIVSVAQSVLLDMAEIGGSERSERRGIRLDGTTVSGDSGSGLFTDDGLVGLVFATTSDDDSVTWATASSEIESFLAEAIPQDYSCDAAESELVVGGQ
jgi:S1-C subfamily serine protease